MSSTSPIRTTLTLFIATFGFAAAACSTADETAASSTTTAESELSVSPSDSAASLTLSGEGGACTPFKSLVDGHLEELKGLCADAQIALPAVIEREGCDKGSVTSVTFKCFDAEGPGRPGEGCRPMAIKDKKGALPEACSDHAEDLQPVVCPHLDGMEPPPPPADGAAPPPKPTGDAPPKPSGDAPSGDAPADRPAPPAGGGAGPHPPRIQCCAPPPPPGARPPGGGGGGAPPSAPAEAPTQVE